jgi:Sec-independent protein translocase protein TatA
MVMTFEQLREIATENTVAIREIRGSIDEFRASMSEVRGSIDEFRTSMGEVRGSIGEVRGSIDEFRTSMGEFRTSMGEVRASIKELDEGHKKTRALLDEVAEAQKETALAQKETKLAQQKTELALQKTQLIVQETSQNIGGVNIRLGEIVEMVVLPGLMKRMNELGHNFTISSPRKKFSKDGEQFAEIDLLLENCDEVMAVEAKARFKLGMMNDFLKAIKLLRENDDITGLKDKTIRAAAAAIGFDKPARELAQELGMYIIDIDQDSENITLTPPDGKIGTW